MDDKKINDTILEIDTIVSKEFSFKKFKQKFEIIENEINNKYCLEYFDTLNRIMKVSHFDVTGIFKKIKVRKFFHKYLDFISFEFMYIEFYECDFNDPLIMERAFKIADEFLANLQLFCQSMGKLFVSFGIITTILKYNMVNNVYGRMFGYTLRSCKRLFEKFKCLNTNVKEFIEGANETIRSNERWFN